MPRERKRVPTFLSDEEIVRVDIAARKSHTPSRSDYIRRVVMLSTEGVVSDAEVQQEMEKKGETK